MDNISQVIVKGTLKSGKAFSTSIKVPQGWRFAMHNDHDELIDENGLVQEVFFWDDAKQPVVYDFVS